MRFTFSDSWDTFWAAREYGLLALLSSFWMALVMVNIIGPEKDT